MTNSPIAFFAYNRPYHTFKTLESLSKNSEAKHTDLYAFIDGHRKNSEIQLIDNVEKIIKSFKSKFKSVIISRSNINLSVGTNQKKGITKVLSDYESVITLEDDVCVSKYFLSYMNKSLDFYKYKKEIWHINAYNYPINFDCNFECFCIRSMHCWGWGTWRDRWNDFINKPLSCDPYYLKEVFSSEMINEFNLNVRSIFWSQVEDNANGKLNNTWAIFWYSHIFLNKGLCLTPKVSLTRNIGHDGSGIHTSFDKNILESKINDQEITSFPSNLEEDYNCLNQISKYLKRKNSFFSKIKRKFYILRIYLKKLILLIF